MEKIIIYGVGESFNYYFMNNSYFVKLIYENDMLISGIADGDIMNRGKEICLDERKYYVKTKEELKRAEYDALLITSSKYYREIKEGLVSDGHDADKILFVEDVIKKIVNSACHFDLFEDKFGLEVGGPSDLFSGIYESCCGCDGVNFSNDTVWWKAEDHIGYRWDNKVLGNLYVADAVDMHIIPDNNYDFLLSSNNLEHIANPLKALEEFKRVVRRGGYILIAVPIKEYTFDHARQFTTFEHIKNDYMNDISEEDLSHLPEIIEKHDYKMDIRCGGREAFIERAYKNIENRCLHHHVFDEKCLRSMLGYLGLEIIDFHAVMSNFIIIGRKNSD